MLPAGSGSGRDDLPRVRGALNRFDPNRNSSMRNRRRPIANVKRGNAPDRFNLHRVQQSVSSLRRDGKCDFGVFPCARIARSSSTPTTSPSRPGRTRSRSASPARRPGGLASSSRRCGSAIWIRAISSPTWSDGTVVGTRLACALRRVR